MESRKGGDVRRRLEARLQKQSKCKPDFDKTTDDPVDCFEMKFSSQEKVVEQQLKDITSADQSSLVESEISILQMLVNENSHCLPPRVLQMHQTRIHLLQDQLRSRLLSHAPKKFTFRKKPKKEPLKPDTLLSPAFSTHQASYTEGRATIASVADNAFIVDASLSNQTAIFDESSSQSKQAITLTGLSFATIAFCSVSLSLHADRLSHCTILAAPCVTSVFIDQCSDCNFVLAAQQVRIHSTHDCNMWLRVKTAPVIENSKQLQFGAYCFSYDQLELHLKVNAVDFPFSALF